MFVNNILLVNSVNFLLNFAILGSFIYIPILGSQLGASDFQVGLIGAAYGGAYLVSSVYSGRESDRRGRKVFIRAGLLLCAFGFASQMLAHDLFTLSLTRAGAGMALGVATAALVTYAFESGSDMGRFSSYGSLGWIAGALASAWLQDFRLIFAVSSLCCAVAFILSLLFPGLPGRSSAGEKKAPRLGKVLKVGFPVYLAIFMRHLGAAAVWVILPLYFLSLGIDRFWLGVLWGTNFAVQFVVMRYLDSFNPVRVFTAGQLLSVAVFVSYAFLKSPWPLLAAQIMLGVAWSCLYVGALLLILRAGEDRGTASGIFQATINLCGVAGPLLGGAIAQGFGYRGVVIFAAALGAAGLLLSLPRPVSPAENTRG
ncbi:MAG: MFS transporter [Bacillota bacterium]